MTTPIQQRARELEPCPFCGQSLTEPSPVTHPRTGLARLHPGGVHDGDCPLSGWGFYDEQLANWNRRVSFLIPDNRVREAIADKRALAEAMALEIHPKRDFRLNPLYFGDPAWGFAHAVQVYVSTALSTTEEEG